MRYDLTAQDWRTGRIVAYERGLSVGAAQAALEGYKAQFRRVTVRIRFTKKGVH